MLPSPPALLALAASLTIATLPSEPQWRSAGTRNGVELSFRDDALLEAREVRASAELPYAADRILAVVCDFTQVLDPDVREARMLSGDLASGYEVYLRYASRFAVVAARDVVIDVRRHANGCTWSEVAGRVDPQRGVVRMPLLRGSWTVAPLASSRSRVTYQIAVRPGGNIPGWMVRRGAMSALADVMARVSRKLIESR